MGSMHSAGRLGSCLTRLMRPPERIEVLVVSGGGMKGVASLGAVSALRRTGALKHVHTVVGTSAGALVAAALATDMASLKLLDGLTRTKYKPDFDLGNLLSTFGLDSGRHLDEWIDVLLGGKAYTFREIRDIHNMRLVVCATNVTERRPEYFGPETSPDMDVALALRMSCTIPLYFSAVTHGGKMYVDGAVCDNFPLAWAGEAYGHHKVLGIAFKPRLSSPDASLEQYVGALLECSTRRHYGADDRRVMQLDTGARSAFEFNMSRRDMKKLYIAGARQARAWLKKHL